MPDAPKVNRYYEGKEDSYVQSVRFKKYRWTESEARTWCKNHKVDGHNVYTDGLDETENEYRFRQYDPDYEKFKYAKGIDVDGRYYLMGYRL